MKRRYAVSLEDIPEVRSFFFQNVREFKSVETMRTAIFDCETFRVLCSPRYLPMKVLGLMQSLKKYIRNNKETIENFVGTGPVLAEYYRSRMEGPYKGPIWEIDRTSAYLEAAKKLQILNEELYVKLRALHKTKRLAVLGSLATVRDVKIFKEGRIVSQTKEFDPFLRSLWGKIAWEVGEQLGKLFEADKSAKFFYVDQMYTPVEQHIEGYKSKLLYMDYDKETNNVVFNDNRAWTLPDISPVLRQWSA